MVNTKVTFLFKIDFLLLYSLDQDQALSKVFGTLMVFLYDFYEKRKQEVTLLLTIYKVFRVFL